MNDTYLSQIRLAHLAHDLDRFRSFVRHRIKDTHVADEVLQDAFARAARAIDQVKDDERLDAWFYRILRNRIADLSNTSNQLHTLPTDLAQAEKDSQKICQCLLPLVERLPPELAQAISSIDLQRQLPEQTAQKLGISVNALHVRRHRGRQQLRELLNVACGMCAKEGCGDCHCAE